MKPNDSGFNVLEAMVALTLVTIIVPIAVPNDAQFVRTNRSEAIHSLLSAAACQEHVFLKHNAFDASACGGEAGNGYYLLSVTTSDADQRFVISAAPRDAQTRDACGVLTLDNRGVKTANTQTGDFARQCWAGKRGRDSFCTYGRSGVAADGMQCRQRPGPPLAPVS